MTSPCLTDGKTIPDHEFEVLRGEAICLDRHHDCFWWPENWPGGRAPARWTVEKWTGGWAATVRMWFPGPNTDLRSKTMTGFTALEAMRACPRLEKELERERAVKLERYTDLREARVSAFAVPG